MLQTLVVLRFGRNSLKKGEFFLKLEGKLPKKRGLRSRPLGRIPQKKGR